MKKRLSILMALFWLAHANLSIASAQQIEGVVFEKSVQVQNDVLHLHRTALLRYLVFIKAYVGALYLPSGIDPHKVLTPVAKRLELSYFHAIEADDFARATRQKIEENVSADALSTISARIEELGRLYQDVVPGDRYALTYTPGNGTRLTLNGQTLGVIDGEDFAKAVFSVWLGKNPIDQKFKTALLGPP